MTPLRFASARRGLLAQRTFTSKSRAMLGAQKRKGGPLQDRPAFFRTAVAARDYRASRARSRLGVCLAELRRHRVVRRVDAMHPLVMIRRGRLARFGS